MHGNKEIEGEGTDKEGVKSRKEGSQTNRSGAERRSIEVIFISE